MKKRAWNTSTKRLKFAQIAGKIFFKNCAGDKIATQSSLSDFWGGFQILKDVLHIRKDQNLWTQDGPLTHSRVQNKRRLFHIRKDPNPEIEDEHLALYRMQTNLRFKLGEVKNCLDQFVIFNPWEIRWNWIAFVEILLLCHLVWWKATLEALQTRPIGQNLLFRRNNSLAN